MTLSAIAEIGKVSGALIAPCVGPSPPAPAPATKTVDGGPGAPPIRGAEEGQNSPSGPVDTGGRHLENVRPSGGVPEWPKGSDCKSDARASVVRIHPPPPRTV